MNCNFPVCVLYRFSQDVGKWKLVPYEVSSEFLLRRTEIYYKVCKYELSFPLFAFCKLKTFRNQWENGPRIWCEIHQYKFEWESSTIALPPLFMHTVLQPCSLLSLNTRKFITPPGLWHHLESASLCLADFHSFFKTWPKSCITDGWASSLCLIASTNMKLTTMRGLYLSWLVLLKQITIDWVVYLHWTLSLETWKSKTRVPA